MLSGSLPISGAFSAKYQVVTVDVGGKLQTFYNDSKGKTLTFDKNHFKLGTKSVNGKVPFSLTVSNTPLGTFFDDEGLVNLNVTQTVSIPVIVLLNNQYFTTTVTHSYKSGKLGK